VSDKPRILQNSRDMLWSLIPLVVLCLLIAGIAGQCSFSPGAPKPGNPPAFDPSKELPRDAKRLGFPIRLPQLPEDWRPNSGIVEAVPGAGSAMVNKVGYVTPSARFIELAQSDATEEQLVSVKPGDDVELTDEQVDGRTWVVYAREEGETVWVTDLGRVRIMITGKGPQDEFADLARAVLVAQPLPTT